jgi:parvulin-like peptidyl-prolyl isomerase
MKQLFVYLLTLFVNSNILIAQGYEPILARVGNSNITKSEFIERYEMTPFYGKTRKGWEKEKQLEFLYTLIAEKLWALQSLAERLDTTEAIKISTESFEKMFIRDLLYKQEIKNKILISSSELKEALNKFNKTITVNFLFSVDKEEIYSLYNFLNQGIPFDTILLESPEYEEQLLPIEISFGQMEESIEEAIFSLNAGEYTLPLSTPEGYYIFKVNNIKQKLLIDSISQKEDLEKVKKIIETRKEKVFYYKFIDSLFSGKKAKANGILLKEIAEKLSTILKVKQVRIKKDEYSLVPDDFIRLKNSFSFDSLKTNFITFEKYSISLEKFLLELSFEGMKIHNTEPESIFVKLNQNIKIYIEREFLSEEGFKRGLNKNTQVQKDLTMWKTNYLFQMLRSKFIDSSTVGDEEAYQTYLKINKEIKVPKQVNIIEILTDSIEIVNKIFRMVNEGIEFREIAKIYNKRESTKKDFGEYGYFPIIAHGELGRIAGLMEVGEVFGPIKLSEGFSVIKLIGKKDEYIEKPEKSFAELKDKIKREIGFEKLNAAINNYTVALANKYNIQIDTDVFNSIETTNINSLGIRYLGFGSCITAVPLVAPMNSWYELYFKKKNQIP